MTCFIISTTLSVSYSETVHCWRLAQWLRYTASLHLGGLNKVHVYVMYYLTLFVCLVISSAPSGFRL